MTYRIYIAGKITDYGNAMLNNIHKFFIMDRQLIDIGFATYNPGKDFLGGVMFGDYTYDMYFENNIEFMKVCDGIIMLDNWEESAGAKREMELARELNIPIFFNVPALVKHFEMEE